MLHSNLDEREQTALLSFCMKNKGHYSISRADFWLLVADDLHDLRHTSTYTPKTCTKFVKDMINERDNALANNANDPNSDRGKDWIKAIDEWIDFVESPEAELKPKKRVRKDLEGEQNKNNVSYPNPMVVGAQIVPAIHPPAFGAPAQNTQPDAQAYASAWAAQFAFGSQGDLSELTKI